MVWSKESRQARGYGAEWDRIRAQILKRDGYVCQCSGCKAANRVLPATHVDHIRKKADGGTDDPSNLQSLNVDCHKLKGIIEKGQLPRIGPDRTGWPMDPNHPWNRK